MKEVEVEIGNGLKKDTIICSRNSNYADEDNWMRVIDVKRSNQSIQDYSRGFGIQCDNRHKSIGFAWVYDGIFCRKVSTSIVPPIMNFTVFINKIRLLKYL